MSSNGTLAVAEPAPLVSITTADELAGAFLAGYGKATRDAYAGDLRDWARYLEKLGVDVFSAHRIHVDAYCREAEGNGASTPTVARRLAALSGFYAYAVDEGLVARSPVQRVRRPRVADESPRLGLDRAEIAALLGAAAESGPRDHALVCLLALNGPASPRRWRRTWAMSDSSAGITRWCSGGRAASDRPQLSHRGRLRQ